MSIDHHDEEDADKSELERLRDLIDADTEATKRLLDEIALQPIPDLTEHTEATKRLLDEIASQPMPDLTVDTEVLNSILVDAEPLPPPAPNLTASDVAHWMQQEVQAHHPLYQRAAVSHISRHFGSRFLREHETGRIASDVLSEFLNLTKDTVVWNRHDRFWRLRQPGDPPGRELPG